MGDGERQVIEAVLAGDVQRYAEIVAKYETPVFNLALRMTGNHDDAWEVSQAAFVKAYANLDGFDTRRRFFSWLYRIAYNTALDLLAQRHRVTELPASLVSRDAGPDEQCASGERTARIQAALLQLSLDHRLALVLRHFLELTYRDMADILEIPEKTVKSRLFEARRRLAGLLEETDRP